LKDRLEDLKLSQILGMSVEELKREVDLGEAILSSPLLIRSIDLRI